MRTFWYVVCTLFFGFLIHLVFSRLLSIGDATPNLMLLFTIAHGFLLGPFLGETVGFGWGLISDTVGVRLFGLQMLLFTLVGYVSGRLRRRVASEKPLAQFVIAVVATVAYGLGARFVSGAVEGESVTLALGSTVLRAALNGVLAVAVFWIVEKWAALWGLHREPV